MSEPNVTGQPITVATLERALDQLAMIMAEAPNQGVIYLPIWRRVEQELANLRNQNDDLAAVRARQRRLLVKV
jgi:hypothetical protein